LATKKNVLTIVARDPRQTAFFDVADRFVNMVDGSDQIRMCSSKGGNWIGEFSGEPRFSKLSVPVLAYDRPDKMWTQQQPNSGRDGDPRRAKNKQAVLLSFDRAEVGRSFRQEKTAVER